MVRSTAQLLVGVFLLLLVSSSATAQGLEDGSRRELTQEEAWVAQRTEAQQRVEQLWKQGQRDSAVALAERIVEANRDVFGTDHDSTTGLLSYLSYKCYSHGKYDRANSCRREIQEIYTRMYGKDDWRTKEARWNRQDFAYTGGANKKQLRDLETRAWQAHGEAKSLHDSGKYKEAITAFEKAAALFKQLYGDSGDSVPPYADCLKRLSWTTRTLGDLDRSEAAAKQAADIYRGWFTTASPQYAHMVRQLGNVAGDRGEYAKAERYYRQALEIYERTRGPIHEDVGDILHQLGALYNTMRQYARAEELLLRALDNYDKQDRRDSKDYAGSQKVLADVLYFRRKFEEAEKQYLEVEKRFAKFYKQESLPTAYLQQSIGKLYYSRGQFEEALRRFAECSQIYTSLGFDNSGESAITNNLIALTQHAMGRYEEAEATYDAAISIQRQSRGMKHPETRNMYNEFAKTLGVLASRHLDAGEYEAAEAKRQKSRDLAAEVYGEKHRVVKDLEVTLGYYDFLAQADDEQRAADKDADRTVADAKQLYNEDKDAEAAKLYEKALDTRIELFGADHLYVAYVHGALGNACYYAKEYDKAKHHARRAAEIYQAIFDESSPNTNLIGVTSRLAKIYEGENNYFKAAEYYQLAREAARKINGEASKAYHDASESLAKAYRMDAQYEQSVAVYRELLEIMERYHGRTFQYAQTLNRLSIVYSARGEVEKERQILEEAMQICESLGEVKRREYGSMTYNFAMVFYKEQKWKEAIEYFQKAIAVYEATDYTAGVSLCKGMLGTAHYRLREYALAEQLLTEAIKGNDAYHATWRSNRLEMWEEQMAAANQECRFADSVRFMRRMLDEQVSQRGEDDWSVQMATIRLKEYEHFATFGKDKIQRLKDAHEMRDRAKKLAKQKKYEQAIKVENAALDQLRRLYGSEGLGIADTLPTIMEYYVSARQFDKAQELAEQRLSIMRKYLDGSSPGLASAYNGYANTFYHAGNYRQALREYQRSAECFAQIKSERDRYGEAVSNIGKCYYYLHELPSAFEHLQKANKILRQFQTTHKRNYFNNLTFLQSYYVDIGDWKMAEQTAHEYFVRAPRDFGEETWQYKSALLDLAQVYRNTDRLDEAETLTRKALELSKTIDGEGTVGFANALNALALLYLAKHDYILAESLLKQSLEIKLAVLRDNDPDLAIGWRNLGGAYRAQGKLKQAEDVYLKALELEQKLQSVHPNNFGALVRLYLQMGNGEEANRFSQLEVAAYEERLAGLSGWQSERQQLAMLKDSRSALDYYLSLHLTEKAQGEAFAHVLRWKGGVFARQQQLRRAARNPDTTQEFRRWSRVTSQLATLALRPPYPDERDLWNQRVSLLSSEKDRLELKMFQATRASSASQAIELTTVKESLSETTALVDFLQYRHWGKVDDKLAYWPKFAVFIVRPGRSPVRVTLEDAEEVAEEIDNWREALDWRKKAAEDGVENDDLGKRFAAALKEQGKAGKRLRDLIWEKIEPHLDGVETVLISPDGALGKLPFNALPGQRDGSYLFHDYAVAVVPVPSMIPELVRRRLPRKTEAPSLLLVGSVNYDKRSGASGEQLPLNKAALPFSFSKLEQDHLETDAVRASFEVRYPGAEIQFLQQFGATEQAFRRAAPQHRWMHISTHGFFAPDVMEAAYSVVPQADLAGEAANETSAPSPSHSIHEGLMSGLAFAYANEITEANEDDGILSATEVSAIDLDNTDLAFLSACQTALGTNISGEGVIGLQRAFQIAGARTTVTTLWSVETQSTRLLLDRFYRNLWNKDNNYTKLEAMREAQIWFLKAARAPGDKDIKVADLTADADWLPGMFQAPEFWAAFVLSGDWE